MQSYTTIIGVVELRLQKQSYTTVQKRYSIGSSTVTLIMKRFKELGLSLDDLKRTEPVKVEKAFYPPENLRHQDIPLPDFEAIHDRMIAMGKMRIWDSCGWNTRSSTQMDISSHSFIIYTADLWKRIMAAGTPPCQ